MINNKNCKINIIYENYKYRFLLENKNGNVYFFHFILFPFLHMGEDFFDSSSDESSSDNDEKMMIFENGGKRSNNRSNSIFDDDDDDDDGGGGGNIFDDQWDDYSGNGSYGYYGGERDPDEIDDCFLTVEDYIPTLWNGSKKKIGEIFGNEGLKNVFFQEIEYNDIFNLIIVGYQFFKSKKGSQCFCVELMDKENQGITKPILSLWLYGSKANAMKSIANSHLYPGKQIYLTGVSLKRSNDGSGTFTLEISKVDKGKVFAMHIMKTPDRKDFMKSLPCDWKYDFHLSDYHPVSSICNNYQMAFSSGGRDNTWKFKEYLKNWGRGKLNFTLGMVYYAPPTLLYDKEKDVYSTEFVIGDGNRNMVNVQLRGKPALNVCGHPLDWKGKPDVHKSASNYIIQDGDIVLIYGITGNIYNGDFNIQSRYVKNINESHYVYFIIFRTEEDRELLSSPSFNRNGIFDDFLNSLSKKETDEDELDSLMGYNNDTIMNSMDNLNSYMFSDIDERKHLLESDETIDGRRPWSSSKVHSNRITNDQEKSQENVSSIERILSQNAGCVFDDIQNIRLNMVGYFSSIIIGKFSVVTNLCGKCRHPTNFESVYLGDKPKLIRKCLHPKEPHINKISEGVETVKSFSLQLNLKDTQGRTLNGVFFSNQTKERILCQTIPEDIWMFMNPKIIQNELNEIYDEFGFDEENSSIPAQMYRFTFDIKEKKKLPSEGVPSLHYKYNFRLRDFKKIDNEEENEDNQHNQSSSSSSLNEIDTTVFIPGL